MTRLGRHILLLTAGALLAPGARLACATTIQDLVRLKGHERNTLVGMGIVIGLDGTGDESKASLVAARPYEQLLRNLGNPIASVDELQKADAYAIVQVTMEIPPTGVRAGDRLDVTVSTLFNATSLAGGELVMSPLRVPLPGAMEQPPLAFANGPMTIEGGHPRRGRVRGGGQMMADIRATPLSPGGTLTLVLDDQYAGYPVATVIAEAINGEFSLERSARLAFVEDAKNVRVVLPPGDRGRPAEFIAALLTIPIDTTLIQTEARIVVNEREGIILVTGDVEVGPVLITHKGLSITTVTPEPLPTPDQPAVSTHRWAGLDTTRARAHNATALADLLRAFDQLAIAVEDQIAIVYELKKTGKLHAEIVSR